MGGNLQPHAGGLMDALDRDLQTLPTPCYVVDEAALINNLTLLQQVTT